MTWFVYDLVDMRDGSTFYVGSTKNLDKRFYGHRNAPQGTCYARIKEIEAANSSCIIRAISQHEKEVDALRAEAERIVALPDLINKMIKIPDIIEPVVRGAGKHPNDRMRRYRAKMKRHGRCDVCGQLKPKPKRKQKKPVKAVKK